MKNYLYDILKKMNQTNVIRCYDLPLRVLFLKLAIKFGSAKPIKIFNAEHPCVFVLSTGRSGTATLTRFFQSADNVLTFHEPYPDLVRLTKFGYQNYNSPEAIDILADTFLAFREEQLNLALRYGKGYVETGLQCTFLAPAIVKLFPQAKFIHMVRNPYMVVRSGMRRNWNAAHNLDKFRIFPGRGSPYFEKWDSMDAFEKTIWQWAEINSWITNFINTLSDDKKFFLRAEDLFDGDKQTISNLFKFISSNPPSSRKINNILKKKINPQTRGNFSMPQNWTDEMRSTLKNLAGKIASDMGYKI
jgi:hypothetical protein